MNNLLPFTIEAYERGEEVVYRNGEKPDETHWFKTAKTSPIITINLGVVVMHNKDGSCQIALNFDLFIKPKTVEKYRTQHTDGTTGLWQNNIEEASSKEWHQILHYHKGTFSRTELLSIEIVQP